MKHCFFAERESVSQRHVTCHVTVAAVTSLRHAIELTNKQFHKVDIIADM